MALADKLDASGNLFLGREIMTEFGKRRTKDVTKDEVLGMIIMGKLPKAG
jgi:hypothetical protein